MMKMLKLLKLAVFVVCIAAFASGCGGGGGSAMTPEEPPPVMECPQGQVGTYPDCTDPGPTDEERIATARETIAGIVRDANTLEQAARAAVTAVEASADATAEQIANARAEGNAALDALRAIVRASGVANAATTPAAAEGAVTSARAALTTLSNARAGAAAIQSAVEAVAGLREQQAEEERLATNGSSLIRHVRDNKLVYNAVIANLKNTATDPLTVGPAASGTSEARFPATTGTAPNVRPEVRRVTVNGLNSQDIRTSPLSGTGRLPHGFDMKNAAGDSFVNAYTDINRENPRARTGLADNTNTPDTNEAVAPKADTDYLLVGIWLASDAIEAFAYGGQPLDSSRPPDGTNFAECNRYAGVANTTCTQLASGFDMIDDIVPTAGESITATYNGDANGAYLAGGAMSYFTANVSLDAEFVNDAGTGRGTIEGEVTNIVAGGKSISGSIELRETTLANDIGGAFPSAPSATLAVGVVAGQSYRGGWRGQFFGQRISGPKSVRDTDVEPVTTAITFSPQAPGSVAGTFNVVKESGEGDAAFIGAFAAHR